MQITSNTTGMPAEVCVSTDKAGRDYCVRVIKGTFGIDQSGEAKLAEEQAPFVYSDVHYGNPGTTSIRYECDFAPFKPTVDIIINGQAMSPDGKPVSELLVGVKVGHLQKIIKVVGDRRWENGLSGLRASAPKPFVSIPLVYERSSAGPIIRIPIRSIREPNFATRSARATERILTLGPRKACLCPIWRIPASQCNDGPTRACQWAAAWSAVAGNRA